MTSHRIKDRRKLFRSGVLECVSGVRATFQNNSLARVAAMDVLVRPNAECCILLRLLGTSPLVLNHIEPRYKGGISPSGRLPGSQHSLKGYAFMGTSQE